MSCVQTILIARTPHAAERNNIRSAAAYEPAGGSYKRKEEVRCLKTADFTKTPDFLHQCVVSAGEEHAVLGIAPSSNIHSSDSVTLSVPNVRFDKELFRTVEEHICRNEGRITL